MCRACDRAEGRERGGVTSRLRIAVLSLLIVLAMPQAAFAHAVLEGSSPGRGAQLQRAPEQVTLRFGESVEAAFGAVQVYDQQGKRVDRGGTGHPSGHGNEVEVGLRGGLGDGTYTATYRVVSADSHPVSGGFTFTVGKGGAPAETVDQLIDAGDAGPVTKVGFGIVRALAYVALALAAGGIVFVAAVWHPALRARAGADQSWRRASEAFARRVQQLTLGAVALGIVTSALGIVFQGAVAGGTAFWQALDPAVVDDVLETHFGTVWGLRLLAWLAVGCLLAVPATRLRVPVLRPASLGATGLAPSPTAPRASAATLALLLAFLCLTPALAGHAATTDPTWLLVPANALHVVCMAVWVGGVASLLTALPTATRPLDPLARTGLLTEAVVRFSTLALAAVAGLVASGTLQAIVQLEAFSDLLDTAFGRAILIKIGLLACLIALGAWNRQRVRPRLSALDAAGEPPGRAGVELRRSLRAEAVLMVAVLGVTAALVSYAPATGASGPFSTSETLGPARVELTVDPARAGANELHLYLFDRRSGRQYERVKELTLTARLPERRIGPLTLNAEPAGRPLRRPPCRLRPAGRLAAAAERAGVGLRRLHRACGGPDQVIPRLPSRSRHARPLPSLCVPRRRDPGGAGRGRWLRWGSEGRHERPGGRRAAAPGRRQLCARRPRAARAHDDHTRAGHRRAPQRRDPDPPRPAPAAGRPAARRPRPRSA